MNDTKPHHDILQSLYEVYKTSDDKNVLKNIATVAWSLGVDLQFDYGYHELSELVENKLSDKTDGNEHYIEVIEKHLANS
jgi:hypothetical protein